MALPWIQLEKQFLRGKQAIVLKAHLAVSRHEAIGLCADFWAWCEDNGVDIFEGPIVITEVEEAARWQGKKGLFFQAMLTAGLLEGDESRCRVHGMSRYQKAANKATRDRERLRHAREVAATSDLSSGDIASPSPVCSRDVAATSSRQEEDVAATSRGKMLDVRIKEEEKETGTSAAAPPVCVSDPAGEQKPPEKPKRSRRTPPAPTAQELEVFRHWVTVMRKRADTLFSRERLMPVRERLADGYSVETLKKAISGCARSDFHMARGEHVGRIQHNDLDLICRDAKNVDKFAALCDAPEGFQANGASSHFVPLVRINPNQDPYQSEMPQ